MKLYADPRQLPFLVTACGDDYVAIDGRRFERSLLLSPAGIDSAWGPADFAGLDGCHLAALAALDCDVLLLGTGRRQRFPRPALLQPLIAAGLPVEAMGTAAACRTYNVLRAEGRAVAAALIVEPVPPAP